MELKGKKFGRFRYGATAVVWARGYLLDAHDITTTDMQWFVSGREVFGRVRQFLASGQLEA